MICRQNGGACIPHRRLAASNDGWCEIVSYDTCYVVKNTSCRQMQSDRHTGDPMHRAEQSVGKSRRCSFLAIASCHVTTNVQDRELTGCREKPKLGAGYIDSTVRSKAGRATCDSVDNRDDRRVYRSAAGESGIYRICVREAKRIDIVGRPNRSCRHHTYAFSVGRPIDHHRHAIEESAATAHAVTKKPNAAQPTSSSPMRTAATGAALLPVPFLRHRQFATTVHRDAAHSDRAARPSWASTARRHAPLPTP